LVAFSLSVLLFIAIDKLSVSLCVRFSCALAVLVQWLARRPAAMLAFC
jgi:hypothetical protein